MRSPTSYFDLRVPLSRIHSWWNAECSVQGGVSQEDFLEWRKCIYQALYRLSHYPLPFEVVIEQGKPVKVPNPMYDTYWDQLRDSPTGEDAAERFQIQSEHHEIARSLEELEDELARLNLIGHEVRDQQDAVEAEQVERIGRGELEGPTTRRRRAGTRRRPRLPFPWVPVAGYLAIVLLTLLEGYQLALPFLDWIGVDTTNLPREWNRNPVGVLSGAGFALAASAGLFFLWYLLVRSGLGLFRSWETAAPIIIMRRVAGMVLLSCVLLVGTILMANMRHGMTEKVNDFQAVQHDQATGTDMGTGVFLFLSLIVPFTAASLHSAIGQSPYWQRRREVAAQQAQFDREEDARLVPAEMVADCLAFLEHRLSKIEQERTRLQTERLALAGRAIAAEQARLEKLEQARRCTLVYAQSLLAALAQDRYFFLRAANRSKAFLLLPNAAGHSSHEPVPPQQFVHPLLTAGSNGQRV